MSNRDLIAIGKIVGAHGVAGGIKIFPLTDFPERFRLMAELVVYGEDLTQITVLTVRELKVIAGKSIVVALTEELKDRESAEALKGNLIMIPPEERIALEEGEYWVDDLIGIRVYEKRSSRYLGKVHSMLATGPVDVYVILDEDGKEHYIPAVSEFIKNVDIDNQVMEIELIEGLWE